MTCFSSVTLSSTCIAIKGSLVKFKYGKARSNPHIEGQHPTMVKLGSKTCDSNLGCDVEEEGAEDVGARMEPQTALPEF